MGISLDRYRLLGRSGLKVSPLCLGTMTFGKEWGFGADKPESRKVLDMYAERGGNFLDTANMYTNGTSETFLGEFLKGRRDRFVLATKFTLNMEPGNPNAGGNSPAETCSGRWRPACAGSRPITSTSTGSTPGSSGRRWRR